MNRVFKFFRRYRNLIKIIDKKTSMKFVVRSVLGALAISFLLVLLPALVIVNMFIYAKLTFLLSLLLLFLIVGWSFLYYYFYYRLLKNYYPNLQEVNTRVPQLVESIFVALFFLVLGIVVLSTAI